MAVDYGVRRIGLAVSDESESLALAYGVTDGIEGVVRAAREAGAGALVVGLPLNMDGSMGSAARKARRFAEELKGLTGLAVELFDERLTSDEAKRRLAGAPLKRSRKREQVNVVAAQIILEGYLGERRRISGRG
jgi:putative Holliday junction resolvase